MDDDQLGQVLRDSLGRHAGRATVDPALVDRARAAARPRRRRTWVLLAAAAAVLVLVAWVAVVSGDDEQPTTAADRAGDVGGPVRAEYWRGVRVDVPADWGYGSAPERRDTGNVLTCFPSAAVAADGRLLDGDTGNVPYVGRPISLTDLCVPYPDNRPDQPATDYAWLGAAVAPGTVELANGLVQETIEINGTTVTVASTDADLRRQVLGSARVEDPGCTPPRGTGNRAAGRLPDVAGLRVCVYELTGSGSPYVTYAATLGAEEARDYAEAVAAGEPPTDQCPAIDYMLTQVVVLDLLDASGDVIRGDAANLFQRCAGITVDADRLWSLESTRLTAAMVRPWAVGGVPAVVQGPGEYGLIGPAG